MASSVCDLVGLPYAGRSIWHLCGGLAALVCAVVLELGPVPTGVLLVLLKLVVVVACAAKGFG